MNKYRWEDMKGIGRWRIALVSLIAFLVLVPAAVVVPVKEARAANAITLGNQTPAGTLYGGNSFTLDVAIDAVTNFDAGQFCVTYSATVLRIDSVTNGSLGGATGTVRVVNASKSSEGVWIVVVDTPDASGVTGGGTLCTVHFTALGTGASPVGFSDLPAVVGPPPSGGPGSMMINDGGGTVIPATWTGNSITVAQRTGDINNDGVVNDADILALGRVIVQLDKSAAIDDVNGDGKVNSADITKIERIIRGLP